MPKIIHYRSKCIGCNSCVEDAPSCWKMSDEDGKSVLQGAVKKKDVFVKEISYAFLEENKQAAKDCPVNIIKIVE